MRYSPSIGGLMLKRTLSFFTLFGSMGTLVCCALPALFVSLGLGATLVSLLGAFPQLIWISERKGLVFGMAGLLLLVSTVVRMRAKTQACPIDPDLARQCKNLKRFESSIYYLSVLCYLIGGFFAFVAPLLY